MKASLLALFLLGTSALAQTTPADALARLKGQPLYLRGHWAENKLSFDADGKPLGTYTQVPFSEAGFDCRSAQVKNGKLILKGKRVGLEFVGDQPQRVARGPGMEIAITLPINGDAANSLNTIFAPDLASLVPSMEEYWQPWAKAHLVPVNERTQDPFLKGHPSNGNLHSNPGPAEVNHIGGDVKPPKVIQSIDPNFSAMAREVKFSGNTQIYLWLEKDGTPSHLRIARPVGLGLDEQALYAISHYKFQPATLNGEPVKVDLYIDVNFQIF